MNSVVETMEDCTFEFVNADGGAWYDVLRGFDDATIYQTQAYGEIRWGQGCLHRVVLKRGCNIVCAAQVAVKTLPGLSRGGIAYIPAGPLVRPKGAAFDPATAALFISALYREFCVRRGAVLRMSYWMDRDSETARALQAVLRAQGFKEKPGVEAQTLLMDLSRPLDDLHKSLEKTWRSSLSKARRMPLELREGTEPELFAQFVALYEDMLARKQFIPGVDHHEFMAMQEQLPSDFKMRVFVCLQDGQPTNATICTSMGDMGVYILGATGSSEAARGANGTYLLQWRMLEWLKENGYRQYDLGGIDRTANPNVYRFKLGLAGKTGREAIRMGAYEASANALNHHIMTATEIARAKVQAAKAGLKKFKKQAWK